MFERYRLEKNDDLFSIAKKYNTTVKALQDINNIYYLDSLREGMEIIVPSETKEYFNYYKVEKGDSLYAIARRYNINPELLASMNGIELDDYIYPNQQILIPKNGYSYYITAEGDTLKTVADTFKTTQDNLIKNNKTVYLLGGQLLVNKKTN